MKNTAKVIARAKNRVGAAVEVTETVEGAEIHHGWHCVGCPKGRRHGSRSEMVTEAQQHADICSFETL